MSAVVFKFIKIVRWGPHIQELFWLTLLPDIAFIYSMEHFTI